jgi:hypothetical protein
MCLSEFCLEVSEIMIIECKLIRNIRSDAPLLFVLVCVCADCLDVKLKHAVCVLMGFMGLCDVY